MLGGPLVALVMPIATRADGKPAKVNSAAALVAFPVAATAVGSVTAAFRRPGPRLTSAIQHLAAGVVFAALAGEVPTDPSPAALDPSSSSSGSALVSPPCWP